ncbi:MAG: serine O-acetyltransferase EpsC [Myxococcaceae bacterium]
MFRAFLEDARELARTATGDTRPKDMWRLALTTDSYAILALTRMREWARRWHVPLLNALLRRLQTILFGIEIGKHVSLGRGVNFIHSVGVVVGGDARIGDRVRFFGSNTVGTAKENGYPHIEEDVWVGAGARVLGPVRVGARARIGANAVVLTDVAPDTVVAGVPAKEVSSSR